MQTSAAGLHLDVPVGGRSRVLRLLLALNAAPPHGVRNGSAVEVPLRAQTFVKWFIYSPPEEETPWDGRSGSSFYIHPGRRCLVQSGDAGGRVMVSDVSLDAGDDMMVWMDPGG